MTTTSLLFPGQGSQEIGMSRDIAEKHSEAMELWKKAERISGIRLREIYWDGDETAMPLTQNLQPALTAANLSVWMLLSKKIRPSYTAGHSLGEYSSFVASGVLSTDAVLSLVSLRGKLMSEADPEGIGAMAALLKMDKTQVQECVNAVASSSGETLVIANYNTPGQYVVSGTKNAIDLIQVKVKEVKGRAIPLAVSGAFHSPLMNEAATELSVAIDSLGKTEWNKAKFPVYCNVSAKAETDATVLKDLLKRQMTSSVFWIDTIMNQWNDGAKKFVECGPKSVLTKMVAPILKANQSDIDENSYESLSVGSLESALTFV